MLRLHVGDHERVLIYRNGRFERALGPGAHTRPFGFDWSMIRYDVSGRDIRNGNVDFLVRTRPESRTDLFHVFEPGPEGVGLVYRDGVLIQVIPPNGRAIYWRGVYELRFQTHDLSESLSVSDVLRGQILAGSRNDADQAMESFLVQIEIADGQVGLLFVDGERKEVLGPGMHAFWNFDRSVRARVVDQRTQVMEVNGQEILTRDKVSLRLNLTAGYRIADPILAYDKVQDPKDYLYKELQFALRELVGAQALDELLSTKDGLEAALVASVRESAEAYGLELVRAGVKDIILPGEMKTLLNRVVEAQKAAEADLIKRREETAATRSLHNTARMLESNPMLVRLKELETLERVSSQIQKLTVYGGIDGLMSELVRVGRKEG